MAKLKSLYRCQDCAYSAPKPLGQCPGCQAWNTMVEEAVEARPRAAAAAGGPRAAPVKLKDLGDAPAEPRVKTGIAELDRLLGGGVVSGQVILLAGPPGIGKSTLMLQAAASLAATAPVLYVSGEESLRQVSGRARRLGLAPEGVTLLSETSLERIISVVSELKPGVLVLDSIQTVSREDLASAPGTVSQVRECAAELLQLAKSRDIVLFMLGHVTKDGALAGPKVLEHLVDTVLTFDTERDELLRVLRAEKNRFGPTDELGLFEMAEKGLREITDAAGAFIEEGRLPAAGRAYAVALEGSRPLLVEVQALVVSTRYPLPRRMATGLDLNRVLVLLAAMEKHLRLRIEDKDVFVSLAGGLRLKDPALDLAVCLAVLSSARDIPLAAKTAFVGEVGLLGSVGRVPQLELRLKEAARAGFEAVLAPERAVRDAAAPANARLKPSGVKGLADAAAQALGWTPPAAKAASGGGARYSEPIDASEEF